MYFMSLITIVDLYNLLYLQILYFKTNINRFYSLKYEATNTIIYRDVSFGNLLQKSFLRIFYLKIYKIDGRLKFILFLNSRVYALKKSSNCRYFLFEY